MLVVDSQIHVWAGEGSSPRHGSAPFPVHEALEEMDAAGVDVAVLHPPGWDPSAVEYTARAVEQHPDRFAAYATLDLEAPDGSDQVHRIAETPGVLGLRFLCLDPRHREWPHDGTMEWMFALAEQLNLPVALCGPVLMPIVSRVAEQYPRLRLVVDHFGLIAYGPDGGLVQSPDVLAWAQHPNVAVKLTGAPDYATDGYPFPGMQRVIRDLFDAYGADRIFWGSDVTRVNGHGGTPHKATWRECLTMFTEHMAWLSQEQLTQVMGTAYCVWHDWSPPARRAQEDTTPPSTKRMSS